MSAPSKASFEQYIKFLPLNPSANYLLVLNAQQLSMPDAKDLLNMLERTNKVNTCGAVLVYGDVNTAVKLLDVSLLQAEITKAIKANKKGVKGNDKSKKAATTTTK